MAQGMASPVPEFSEVEQGGEASRRRGLTCAGSSPVLPGLSFPIWRRKRLAWMSEDDPQLQRSLLPLGGDSRVQLEEWQRVFAIMWSQSML